MKWMSRIAVVVAILATIFAPALAGAETYQGVEWESMDSSSQVNQDGIVVYSDGLNAYPYADNGKSALWMGTVFPWVTVDPGVKVTSPDATVKPLPYGQVVVDQGEISSDNSAMSGSFYYPHASSKVAMTYFLIPHDLDNQQEVHVLVGNHRWTITTPTTGSPGATVNVQLMPWREDNLDTVQDSGGGEYSEPCRYFHTHGHRFDVANFLARGMAYNGETWAFEANKSVFTGNDSTSGGTKALVTSSDSLTQRNAVNSQELSLSLPADPAGLRISLTDSIPADQDGGGGPFDPTYDNIARDFNMLENGYPMDTYVGLVTSANSNATASASANQAAPMVPGLSQSNPNHPSSPWAKAGLIAFFGGILAVIVKYVLRMLRES